MSPLKRKVKSSTGMWYSTIVTGWPVKSLKSSLTLRKGNLKPRSSSLPKKPLVPGSSVPLLRGSEDEDEDEDEEREMLPRPSAWRLKSPSGMRMEPSSE